MSRHRLHARALGTSAIKFNFACDIFNWPANLYSAAARLKRGMADSVCNSSTCESVCV